MNFKIVALSILIVSLVFLSCQSKQDSLWDEITLIKDITFGSIDGVDLKLDLAMPQKRKRSFPALVFVHPGGWSMGGRSNYNMEIMLAARRGYVAISVDYRLTDKMKEDFKAKYPFPAQIQDVKCAVRWLRANAKQYRVDPERIGAYGWSAGGHLALLLGLTDAEDGLEGNCGDLSYSSKVQAVLSISGPTDLSGFFEAKKADTYAVKKLIGGLPEEMPDKYRAASPITYVTEDDPPVLLFHGGKDDVVPVQQAIVLHERMNEIGIHNTMVIQEDIDHGLFLNLNDDFPVWDFFDEHLK